MQIRVAEAGDIEVVEALRYAALSTSAPSAYSPREVVELLDSLDVDELRAMVEDRQLFVAETDGRVVGQLGITLEWSDWRNGNFWWIQSVYVAPEARCHGVFRKLYEHVLAAARNEPNVIGVRLYVEHDNQVAQATYAKLGMALTSYHVMEKCPL